MPLVPVYRDTGSPLHATRAGVAAAFTLAPCVAALVTANPLVLGGALACVISIGLSAGVGAELRSAARWAVPLAVLVAAINPLVSREGLTLLVQGPSLPLWGTLDVTLEAVVFGAIAGLRVIVIVLAFAVYSAVVDPDRVLRALRRVAPRSALTASLATRLVPLLTRDAERMREAYGLRADAVQGGGRRGRLRRAGVMTRALGAGALERAMDAAASLEVRGYGSRAPATRAQRLPWSRDERAFALAALLLAGVPVALRLSGAGWFEPYPTAAVDAGTAALAAAAALSVIALAPFAFCMHRRARRRAYPGHARA